MIKIKIPLYGFPLFSLRIDLKIFPCRLLVSYSAGLSLPFLIFTEISLPILSPESINQVANNRFNDSSLKSSIHLDIFRLASLKKYVRGSQVFKTELSKSNLYGQ